MSNELKCCPFGCNGDLFVVPDETGSGGQHVAPYHAGCSICKAERLGETMEAAIAAWNTRRPTPEQSREYAEGYADAAEIFAFYVEDHCVDGADHANAIRTMKRPDRAHTEQSGEAQDAARYRYLRARPIGKSVPLITDGIQFIFATRDESRNWVVHSRRGDEMDAAIDAAMDRSAQSKGD